LSRPAAAGADLRPAEAAAEEMSAVTPKTTDEDSPLKGNAPAPIRKRDTSGKNALFDPYSQIPDYIHQGLTVPEVAARLDLPEAAVDLYVNLRMSAA
jgi:hypothetical protein